MKQAFIEKRFNKKSQEIIEQANTIIAEYKKQDLILTIRQLYYQFVGRGLLENTQPNYKRIVNIINDARLAGLVDWRAIEDRTRNVQSISTWKDPASIVESCVDCYKTNKWLHQEFHVEVWIEKEALTGVIAHICRQVEVPYFACRGYVSQSEMYASAKRLAGLGKPVIILHLGDHDPSGIDMTRDNDDRLELLSSNANIEVKRIALNMNQIKKYSPPPNPTKLTDSRAVPYMAEFGKSSWELDALSPTVIRNLIKKEVAQYRDDDIWAEDLAAQEKDRESLERALESLRGNE
jgi:hypothetical protein